MFDLYLSLDQQKRQAQALDEQQQHRLEIANRNRELTAEGRFDGITGCKPNKELFADQAYWSGYSSGQQLYYSKLFGVELDREF
jgi:hypothetical protein